MDGGWRQSTETTRPFPTWWADQETRDKGQAAIGPSVRRQGTTLTERNKIQSFSFSSRPHIFFTSYFSSTIFHLLLSLFLPFHVQQIFSSTRCTSSREYRLGNIKRPTRLSSETYSKLKVSSSSSSFFSPTLSFVFHSSCAQKSTPSSPITRAYCPAPVQRDVYSWHDTDVYTFTHLHSSREEEQKWNDISCPSGWQPKLERKSYKRDFASASERVCVFDQQLTMATIVDPK